MVVAISFVESDEYFESARWILRAWKVSRCYSYYLNDVSKDNRDGYRIYRIVRTVTSNCATLFMDVHLYR